MNFKKLKYAALGAAALALAACSEVDQSDRFTYVPPVTVNRGVLIEDFTGQACINCPYATDMIHELQQQYGNHVVAVGIHSGTFSKMPPTYQNKYPLWTAVGDEYYSYWNISSQPKGIINRQGGEMLYQNWAEAVANGLQQKTGLAISVSNDYDAATKKLTISTTLECLAGNNAINGKLQLWIIQDGITALQLFPGNVRDKNYVHNHVFRYAVNGTWGEDVSVAEGEPKTITTETTLDDSHIEQGIKAPEFVPENMSVVAFVYNGNGVENVVQVPVVAKTAE